MVNIAGWPHSCLFELQSLPCTVKRVWLPFPSRIRLKGWSAAPLALLDLNGYGRAMFRAACPLPREKVESWSSQEEWVSSGGLHVTQPHLKGTAPGEAAGL